MFGLSAFSDPFILPDHYRSSSTQIMYLLFNLGTIAFSFISTDFTVLSIYVLDERML